MKKVLILSFVFFKSCLLSAESGSELTYFEASEENFSAYINQLETPKEPDLTQLKTIVNNDYPIEIALFKDKRWFYNLPRLGTGHGTWRYENNRIKLNAERKLFDILIWLEAGSERAESVIIKFSDRFGPKVLSMEKMNFD